MTKNEAYQWACVVIREHVDKGSFGNLVVSIANGHIQSVKEEIHLKAPLDVKCNNR